VSERIREDASSLAARVESQSATLEQTAATTEGISSGVRSSSAALEDAESLASDVRQTTGEGTGRVGAAIEAVLRIQSESEGIQQIVAVIESIAFQTNLLALDAAVEAARAGEQGKGFAVVASEVRTLAQRTSEAAKDIKKKVSNSGGSVEDGVRYAEVAGKSLSEIEAKVDTLVARIQRCAETGRDQAGSIAEMNRAITHLDTIGQESSVVSDRNPVSAQKLAAEVAALDQLIGSFKMGGGEEAMREAS
jgi:methyl-accepting chemotaxis protein